MTGGSMTIEKKLLVLMDGSERSMGTVAYLNSFMPVDAHTRIVLFHVYSGMPEDWRELYNDPNCTIAMDQLKGKETETQLSIRSYLETAKKMLVAGGFPEICVEIKSHSLNKGVARDIIHEAKNGYTAVVLRRRGMGALKRIILGSVAVKLLQSLNFIPIIFVGPAPPVKKILLAVDGSDASVKAVTFAAAFLGRYDYEVCIFHAIPGLGRIQFDLDALNPAECKETEAPEACVQAFKIKVAKMFQNIKEILISSGCNVEKISEKIVSGVVSRSEAIIQEAEDGGYSEIVVGRRGLSKVEAFFMGRVGHKVVYGGNRFTLWVI
jgi:nucleotide-binding universal stress UspA family protein